MKETKKSLKGYFIVVGILGILTSISPVITAADILTKVLSIVLVVLSGMFIFYGIKLYDYIFKCSCPFGFINKTINYGFSNLTSSRIYSAWMVFNPQC